MKISRSHSRKVPDGNIWKPKGTLSPVRFLKSPESVKSIGICTQDRKLSRMHMRPILDKKAQEFSPTMVTFVALSQTQSTKTLSLIEYHFLYLPLL